ncbi:protein Aster-C isoform X2 [Nelusetta ayraudi]|uniref:protein Aster-C isoform X2 n=1 Tax=Nelusetta ayraudi TaxID=303726 RepID=UPI003F7043C3
MHVDQVSNPSVVTGEDVTEESVSQVDLRWSSEEDESSDPQGQCLAAPQSPLPTYKQRYDEFKKLFKELPETEILLVDFPCALHRDILLQGRLYLSENWLCFYSNVFWGTKITLTLKDVVTITREKTARLIPNAIQVCTSTEKFFFASFPAREKTYTGVFRMWQNTLMDKPLTCLESWQMIKHHYGHDLGLSPEEMEGLQITAESCVQASVTVRPAAAVAAVAAGDDGLGKQEHASSVRLPGMEHWPLDASTPQLEDLPSPLGSQSAANMDDSRNPSGQRRSPLPKHSLLSLDLNANENSGTEQSGSESLEDAVEERVGSSEVQGRLYLNKVFHISASKMFELLFTDSNFMQRFFSARKILNNTFTGWQKDSSGNMKRTLNYTVTINNPLIGKFSAVTEYQTLYRESRDGHYYLVDSEVYTHDVPYHDYFYTQTRYYIIRNSKRKCRLRVYTNVKYKKQPWGVVKSFITKNTQSEIEDNFRQLEADLLEEEAELNQGSGDPGKMGGLRRRRRAYSRTMPEHVKPKGQNAEQHRDGNLGSMEIKGPNRWNTKAVVAVMSVILLILTVMNLGLFFKLSAMEDIAHRMYLNTKHRLRERSEASFAAEYSPGPSPAFMNREETQLLKTVLQDSINLLEQLRRSLVVLQQNFASHNQTLAPQ